jgi:hypothetical protein
MECFQNKRLWNKGERERLLRKRKYHLAVTGGVENERLFARKK